VEISINPEQLIEFGIRAPSGHNTQPWMFSIGKNDIQIYPDFDRSLPVVDSDHHALYISLGCAAENIVIAARTFGLRASVETDQTESGDTYIKIPLETDSRVQPDDLFNYIQQRQSTRNAYTDRKPSRDDLNLLKHSFEFDGIELLLLTAPGDIEKLEPLIIEGNNLQFQNRDFVHELVHWIRFSKREARRKADGLWSKCMGFPAMNRFIGNIVMKYVVSAKSEAKRWKKLIDATAGFALFLAEQNDPPHWIRLGRGFQRFGLTATKLELSHAHVNMPCEELEVRKKLIDTFNLGNRHPLLLIRFGYSEKMPYSLRRSTDEVMLSGKDKQ